MKLNAHMFGFAGSLTIGICYSLFAACMKFIPKQTINLLTSAHMMRDLPPLYSLFRVNSGAFFIGLLLHMLFGYLFVGMIAKIYNIVS